MKIKRYFAPTIREAISNVRDELGLDAVILSNTTVEGGVELVAAADYDAALVQQQAAPGASPPARPAAGPKPGAKPKIEWMQEPVLVDMRRELNSLRNLLEQQLSGLAWGEMGRRHPLRVRVMQELRRIGLSPLLCRAIAGEVDGGADYAQAWRQALAILAHRLRVTNDDILAQGGIVALVGPTGVGKTTTLAKLAARFVLRHGQRQLALVSVDRERIGAREQLHAYGRILGVPTAAAGNAAELRAVLTSLRDKRLVLIDTAGFSQKDARVSEQLALLNPGFAAIRSYLLLSAATQLPGLQQVVRAFARTRLGGCIITKLDEAARLGDLLSVLAEHPLPAAYVSDGQRIPEDLRPARAHHLVSTAVALARRANSAPAETHTRTTPHARS